MLKSTPRNKTGKGTIYEIKYDVNNVLVSIWGMFPLPTSLKSWRCPLTPTPHLSSPASPLDGRARETMSTISQSPRGYPRRFVQTSSSIWIRTLVIFCNSKNPLWKITLICGVCSHFSNLSGCLLTSGQKLTSKFGIFCFKSHAYVVLP